MQGKREEKKSLLPFVKNILLRAPVAECDLLSPLGSPAVKRGHISVQRGYQQVLS